MLDVKQLEEIAETWRMRRTALNTHIESLDKQRDKLAEDRKSLAQEYDALGEALCSLGKLISARNR